MAAVSLAAQDAPRPLRMGPIGLSAAIAVPCVAAASLAANQGLQPAEGIKPLASFIAVAVAGALWLSIWMRDADLGLYAIAVGLTGLGLVVLQRLDPELFLRQRSWAIIALSLCLIVATVLTRPRRLEGYTYLCGAAAAALVGLTIVAGVEINERKQWLALGPVTVQPSELSKVLMCVFLAGYLGQRRRALADWHARFLGIPCPSMRHLGPLLVMWASSVVLLIFQRDLGCALVLFCVFLTVLYAATSRWIFVALGLGLFALAAKACQPFFSHVAVRVTAWLDPWPHIDGPAGYQITQSLFALASGGAVGTGLGRGLPGVIPVVESDFIFSAIAEELGYLGAAAVCAAYVLLVARIIRHALSARSDFTCLLGTGLAAGIGLQAAIIVAGVTKAIPMTGITLPFISHGGSSLAAGGIALGVLLRLSAESNARLAERGPVPAATVESNPAPLARAHVWIFAALTVWIGYWQIIRGPELSLHPRNPRLLAMEESIERGRILTDDGTVLAESDPETHERAYPLGALVSPIVGYRHLTYGLGGMEASQGGYLLGLAKPRGSILDVIALRERRERGYDVRLTIDMALQKRAWDLLGQRRGAIVAIEPSTGAIRALVAKPAFEPDDIDKILKDPESNEALLLNRATQGLYVPGSAFKVFVASAALDSGAISPSMTVECTGETILHDDRVRCWKPGGHGAITLKEAVAGSCNIYFANVGLRLGAQGFEQYARRFRIGQTWDLGIGEVASSVPTGDQLYPAMLMESSFGQGAVVMTPLQMALIASVVANKGALMEPYLVEQVLDGEESIWSAPPRAIDQVVSAKAATEVARLMRAAVDTGTAASGRVPGVPTAGKTGTAENPHGEDHAWFVAFAPVDAPELAVAVLAENAGGGAAVAAPMAREVMKLWLERE